MTPASRVVSTAGRVFVAQLTRDLTAREAFGAGLLSPGTTHWHEAFRAFGLSTSKAAGPVKAARLFRGAIPRLRTAQKKGACFVNSFMGRSRSAFIEVLTYEVAKHPLTNAGYDGIVVRAYHCILQRTGRIMVGYGDQAAYVSWHALARMHERSGADIFLANGIVGLCGFAGLLMRESAAHANTEINYTDTDMICTGVLRFLPEHEGRQHSFFDVLTVLPIDDDRPALLRKREQGDAIAHAVATYLRADTADPHGYGGTIPVIQFRQNDYVTRELNRESGEPDV